MTAITAHTGKWWK